ncbi:hypothetical protein CVT26_009340 [Gymnopilus dilepis]|uniref:Uncharacterized protein n=1 Tax=Gymnopilus dilepis TaxID=231916 RepID=A0A409YA68_9AGAR|nr:hypothetical protein CVT26_009340 [Gymnopilus dilepis]
MAVQPPEQLKVRQLIICLDLQPGPLALPKQGDAVEAMRVADGFLRGFQVGTVAGRGDGMLGLGQELPKAL